MERTLSNRSTRETPSRRHLVGRQAGPDASLIAARRDEASLLHGPLRTSRGGTDRAMAIAAMQRIHGNRAAQRFLHGSIIQREDDEDEKVGDYGGAGGGYGTAADMNEMIEAMQGEGQAEEKTSDYAGGQTFSEALATHEEQAGSGYPGAQSFLGALAEANAGAGASMSFAEALNGQQQGAVSGYPGENQSLTEALQGQEDEQGSGYPGGQSLSEALQDQQQTTDSGYPGGQGLAEALASSGDAQGGYPGTQSLTALLAPSTSSGKGPRAPEWHEGINLKDKRFAGTQGKLPTIYDRAAIRQLAKRSKYTYLKALHPAYTGETKGKKVRGQSFNTKYLTKLGREQFRMTVQGGKLLRGSGQLDTQGMQSLTTSSTAGIAMYVMSPDGTFYAISQKMSRIHHSSLLAGGPVACAGGMMVAGGTLKYLDNSSGHYHPDPWHLVQAVRELRDRGIPPGSYHVGVRYLDRDGKLLQKVLSPSEGAAFLKAADNDDLESILPGAKARET